MNNKKENIMANLCCIKFLVIGKKEDRDNFFNALDMGNEKLRIGKGLEEPYIVKENDEENYTFICGSVNGSLFDNFFVGGHFSNDPEGLKIIQIEEASKYFNLQIEAFGSDWEPDTFEHYIFEKGIIQSSDNRYRNIDKIGKDLHKQCKLLKALK